MSRWGGLLLLFLFSSPKSSPWTQDRLRPWPSFKALALKKVSTPFYKEGGALRAVSSQTGRPGGLVVTTNTFKVGSKGFDSRYSIFFLESRQLPRALNSVGKHNSTRVDEGRRC